VVIGAQSALIASALPLHEILASSDTGAVVLYTSLRQNEKVLAENFFYFSKPKNMALEYADIRIETNGSGNTIVVSSSQFVKDLYLFTDDAELRLSDNFFDLLPGKPKEIFVEEGNNLLHSGLIRFMCLNNIYGN
jgi:beta-mannosidase